MSDNIIPFNNNSEEDKPCCPSCELAEEYFVYLLDTLQNKTLEDGYGVIRELVEQAKDLGVIEYLEHELEHKAELLDRLTYGGFEE